MYCATRRLVDLSRPRAFGATPALAVREFIGDFDILPAVVYGPDGRVVARLIVGEMPDQGEDRYEPVASTAAEVSDPRD